VFISYNKDSVVSMHTNIHYGHAIMCNTLESRGNYSTTSNNMKLVGTMAWMGGLLHLVQVEYISYLCWLWRH